MQVNFDTNRLRNAILNLKLEQNNRVNAVQQRQSTRQSNLIAASIIIRFFNENVLDQGPGGFGGGENFFRRA